MDSTRDVTLLLRFDTLVGTGCLLTVGASPTKFIQSISRLDFLDSSFSTLILGAGCTEPGCFGLVDRIVISGLLVEGMTRAEPPPSLTKARWPSA